jgi:S1-C subfamily serine protease
VSLLVAPSVRIVLLCGAIGAMLASSAAADATQPDDFTRRQSAARTVAAEVAKSVVAIVQSSPQAVLPKHHKACGSGVIISADGLILSQYHVTHMLDPSDSAESRKPGERVTVFLADGNEQEAELLGADLSFDLSLLRLVNPGPHPYCSLHEQVEVAQGDFVLKLGHPLGYRAGRGPVLRIGRVLCHQDDSFISDCHVTGGDSGGPLFDLRGNLVGIVRSAPNHPLRPSARSGMLFTCTTSNAIRPRLESMQRGEIARPDQKLIADSITRLQRASSLPPEKWTQGTALRAELRSVVARARKCVVVIKDGDESVGLGTIVHSDGWVITKASELPKKPVCLLENLEAHPAELVGINVECDLALLRLRATDLPAIAWSGEPVDLRLGTIVVAPGIKQEPIAWGIVSVASRDLEGPFPNTTVAAPRHQANAAPSEVTGTRVNEGYRVETVSGELASAGIRPGDILRTVDNSQIQSGDDLIRCLNGHLRREPVNVQLSRTGGTSEIDVRLTGRRPFRYSFRADDFPTIFEHDVPLTASECGGPIVGLDGRALGITIASISAHGCMAIPFVHVKFLVQDLRSRAATAAPRAKHEDNQPE